MKETYKSDYHNRLVFQNRGGTSGVRRFKKVLSGRFRSRGVNELFYTVTNPEKDMPREIRLKGSWGLDREHRLTYRLAGRKSRAGEKIVLTGGIIDARRDALTFSLATRTETGEESIYTLTLSGVWQIDARNRLTFQVARGRGSTDTLTFRSAWHITRTHALAYAYTLGKEGSEHSFTLRGDWDMTSRSRLTLFIEQDRTAPLEIRARLARWDSRRRAFLFTASVGTRPEKREIILKGTWRVKKNLRLFFEIEYEKGRRSAIEFSAELTLDTRTRISARLKDRSGKDLAVTVRLSRALFKDKGEAYLKAAASGRRSWEIAAGVGLRW